MNPIHCQNAQAKFRSEQFENYLLYCYTQTLYKGYFSHRGIAKILDNQINSNYVFVCTKYFIDFQGDVGYASNLAGLIFAPFTSVLWIFILIAYLVTSLAFWLVSRINPSERWGACLLESFWCIASSFVYVSRPSPNVSASICTQNIRKVCVWQVSKSQSY